MGFRYPGKEAWALRGLDLFVPRGQSLALVGHNGAGKTTFIKLLTRLYEPTEGRILLDGKDLQAWDLEALRRRMGVVFQDYNQYQLNVRDNVGLGSVEHRDDEGRIARAVERGGATEVIQALGAGLDTQRGRWFKGGAELSGGQWQKIALARAFMREEADILVLDEPTAALDAEAEHAVFERFKSLAEGRTSILISHRFPTVRMADRILVMEGGRIRSKAPYDALLAQGGRYAHLSSLQAQGWLPDRGSPAKLARAARLWHFPAVAGDLALERTSAEAGATPPSAPWLAAGLGLVADLGALRGRDPSSARHPSAGQWRVTISARPCVATRASWRSASAGACPRWSPRSSA